jgi:hypothetical protein
VKQAIRVEGSLATARALGGATATAGGARSVDGNTVNVVRRLDELRRRLRREYPNLAEDALDAAVDAAWAHTAGARVETYRMVFVERHARAALARHPCT